MCDLVQNVVLLTLLVCSVGAGSVRPKRQLSPAVRLEHELHPLIMGVYGYGPEVGIKSLIISQLFYLQYVLFSVFHEVKNNNNKMNEIVSKKCSCIIKLFKTYF
uniref:Secreted protein n=1 Tax=Heterorhabditis bacteriophora TaxID=37862 RepID=A0A1I7WSE1_HETBA